MLTVQAQQPFVPLEEDEHRIKTYNTMQKLNKAQSKICSCTQIT